MATYLKHLPSGDIYPYHELFAANKEFVPIDVHGDPRPPDPPPEPDFVFNETTTPVPPKVKPQK